MISIAAHFAAIGAKFGISSRGNASPLTLAFIRRRGLALLGWPGLIGVGILSICPAFYFSSILPGERNLDSLRRQVGMLRHEGRNAAKISTPEEQLAGFYRMFPLERSLPDRLEAIFAAAQNQGIELDRGEYRVAIAPAGKLLRFQVVFPVKGEYPKIRSFLAALLADIPQLGLEQVTFKRGKIAETTVEARITLALYAKGGGQ